MVSTMVGTDPKLVESLRSLYDLRSDGKYVALMDEDEAGMNLARRFCLMLRENGIEAEQRNTRVVFTLPEQICQA